MYEEDNERKRELKHFASSKRQTARADEFCRKGAAENVADAKTNSRRKADASFNIFYVGATEWITYV